MVRRLPAKQFSVGSIPTGVSYVDAVINRIIFSRIEGRFGYQPYLRKAADDHRTGLPLRRDVEIDETIAGRFTRDSQANLAVGVN